MNKALTAIGLFLALAIAACTKSTQEVTGSTKTEKLFEQMKGDPKFSESVKCVDNMMHLLTDSMPAMDSTVLANLKDKTIPFKEKASLIHFTKQEEMAAEQKKFNALQEYLTKTYPMLKQLSPEESKAFYKKAATYFLFSKH